MKQFFRFLKALFHLEDPGLMLDQTRRDLQEEDRESAFQAITQMTMLQQMLAQARRNRKFALYEALRNLKDANDEARLKREDDESCKRY